MINCHFNNSIDRTPLLFKLNTFLYDALELDEDNTCFRLAPRCNDSLYDAELKWALLIDIMLNTDGAADCYFTDTDGIEFADFDSQLFTCL